jgi:hypothetical protein
MDTALRIKILQYLKEQDAIVHSMDIKTPFIEYLQTEEQRTKFFHVVSHLHSEKLIEADGYYDLAIINAGKRPEIESVNITARLKTKGEEYLRGIERPPHTIYADNRSTINVSHNSGLIQQGDYNHSSANIQSHIAHPIDQPKTKASKIIIAAIVSIISGVIVGFILFKMGWI